MSKSIFLGSRRSSNTITALSGHVEPRPPGVLILIIRTWEGVKPRFSPFALTSLGAIGRGSFYWGRLLHSFVFPQLSPILVVAVCFA